MGLCAAVMCGGRVHVSLMEEEHDGLKIGLSLLRSVRYTLCASREMLL